MTAITDLAPITPSFCRIVFPSTVADSISAQPYTVADISLASLALPEYANVATNGQIHLIKSSAVAAYNASSVLTNSAELLALAQQISTDFYRWNLAKLDQVFAGVCAWAPEGSHDSVEWVHEDVACYTRVQRPEWNATADLMHAGTPWQAGMRGSITNWLLYQDVNTQSVGNLQIRGELTSYSGSNYSFAHRARVTTATLPGSYSTSGNVITESGFGSINPVDGVTLALGDRILVNFNPALEENGLYAVTVLGDGGTQYVLTRTPDADTSAKVRAGMLVVVTEGTANADTLWELSTDDPITLNTTALKFIQIGGNNPATFVCFPVVTNVTFSAVTVVTNVTTSNVTVVTGLTITNKTVVTSVSCVTGAVEVTTDTVGSASGLTTGTVKQVGTVTTASINQVTAVTIQYLRVPAGSTMTGVSC